MSLRILYFFGGFLTNSVLLRLHGVISAEHIFYPSMILGLIVLQIILYEVYHAKR